MVHRFNLSSSSSCNDDDGTASTDYTNEYSDYYDKNRSKNDASKLIREAENLINKGIQNLGIQDMFGIGPLSCGVPQFQQRARACHQGVNGDDDVDIDEGVKLDWRKDPYHSMSDWTLIVRDGSQRQPQTYHIHKSVISYGDRKSGFFVKIFEREIFEGNNRHRRGGGATEVVLPKRAAECVPQLLDFIYSDKLDLNAACAPPLRHLANTFDVRELYALVSSFIQSDISESTITTYIREAESVKDKELIGLGMSLATAKFDVLSDDALLKLQPHIFQQLTSIPQLNCPSSERLSQRIAVYARGRSEEINDEVFYFMTHAQILPRICPTEAMWYLNFAASKFGNVLVDDSMGGYEGTLKRRCIVAAAQDWRESLVLPVKEEVRRKVEGGDGITGGDTPRRRLFVDGDDEVKLDKGRGYMSLPINIRVELLEEALLSAAAAEGNSDDAYRNANMLSKARNNLPTEDRGDSGKREFRKGRREKRQMV